jgi:S1-C subfamily serine protease
MVKALKDRGWVGIEMEGSGNPHKMKITRVLDKSPAKKSGLKVGDVLFAVNGVEFSEDNKAKLKEIKGQMKPGVTLTYTVLRGSREKQIDVTLAEMPDYVRAQMVGGHMIEHAKHECKSKADKG